jgi:hypothetical protein
MQFGKERIPVVAFGVPVQARDGYGDSVLKDQVFVRDYISDQNFIVELATNSRQRDRLILARVEPQQTLADTWERVAARIESPAIIHNRRHLMSNEVLQVPVLALRLRREYDELYDGLVQSCEFTDGLPLRIESARQEIRFRLDERGAELFSFADIVVITLDGDDEPRIKPRQFIFNRPFLLAMCEGESEPYFLAWIATAEVMEQHSP